jgi:hypothetical protein
MTTTRTGDATTTADDRGAAVPAALSPVSAGPYQCTADDYREANFGVRRGGWRAALVPALVAAYIVGLWLWMAHGTIHSEEARAGRAAAAGAGSLGHLIAKAAGATAPVVAGVPLLFLWAIRFAAGRTPEPWDARFDPRRRRVLARIVRFALWAVAAMVLLTAWNLSGVADWYERFLVLTLALYVLLSQSAFLTLIRTVGISRRWAAQPWLHHPATLEATSDGLTLAWPDVREQCRWSMFRGFKETPNLLLLYPSPYEFRMIPKRAFAGPADLTRFKAVLATHVRSGFFLPEQEPTRFPVPAVPVAPLPVVPIGEPPRGVTPPPLPARGGPRPAPTAYPSEPSS